MCTYPDKAVLGLELGCGLHAIVDQSETSALATAEGSAETYAGKAKERKERW